MKTFDVMLHDLDTVEIEAERFEVGSSIAGTAYNNLTFYGADNEIVATFASGAWSYVQRLTAEEIAESAEYRAALRAKVKETMN